ncbi:TetR/AcrR family transcriptional regulator [Sphingomicrobium arenosum]|uniref:TetR/AcrR family transcriptional regulator n=1 Tax=Sphingomicrobium arenosum TaxID=2233861 RepID=UPI00223ED9A2|nr:TetR/AcrR family transcriptional regulator [Sphingomicrobium arenosum]
MADRLVEKTGPAVKLAEKQASKGERTRSRIMDIAYESIVQKGFAATSIEELVEAAGITKSGFFYHFKDKNDLARHLFDRFLSEDEEIVATLEERARGLADDPLQSFLIFLNLYAQLMDEMEEFHPGCMVASVAYQEQLFDSALKEMNVEYLLRMRERFERWLGEIRQRHEPRGSVEAADLADMLTGTVEGAIILSRSLRDDRLMGRQMRLYREHIKLLFGA